jgi:hypothetical protein
MPPSGGEPRGPCHEYASVHSEKRMSERVIGSAKELHCAWHSEGEINSSGSPLL